MSSSFSLMARRPVALMVVTLSLLFANVFSAHAAVDVVVTIRPLHSLVSLITTDVTEPKLLLTKKQDPHHFHLKPSQSKMLHNADIIFMQSDEFEVFMKDISTYLQDQVVVSLDKVKSNEFTNRDHLWLHPEMTIKMLERIAYFMGEVDSDNEKLYQQNLALAISRVRTAMGEWQTTTNEISPNASQQLVVDYDSLTPLMSFLGQSQPRTLLKSHGNTSWRSLEALENANIRCLFSTHGNPRILKKAQKLTGAELIMADILGESHPTGSELYFELMDQLMEQLYHCMM